MEKEALSQYHLLFQMRLDVLGHDAAQRLVLERSLELCQVRGRDAAACVLNHLAWLSIEMSF